MKDCYHVQLLSLWQEKENSKISLAYHNRLRTIADSLPRSSVQYPTILFFLGHKSKTAALRSIYNESKITNHRHYGAANIEVDPLTTNNDNPTYIIDVDIDKFLRTGDFIRSPCHDTITYSINEPVEVATLSDMIYSKLLSPFVDVFCIFADDIGGLAAVVSKLASWASKKAEASIPSTFQPRVLVVTCIPEEAIASAISDFFTQVLTISKFSASFAALNIVNIVGTSLKSRNYRQLEPIITREILASRNARIDAAMLFSSDHLAVYFSKAVRHFTEGYTTGFNFVLESRRDYPVRQEFQQHLVYFLKWCIESGAPNTAIFDFIASAIILDSLPPSMHNFSAVDIFNILYSNLCCLAFQEFALYRSTTPQKLCNNLCMIFSRLKSDMIQSNSTARVLRITSLTRNTAFATFKTMATCLYCLQRMPEHVLKCGHTICDICVMIFGTRSRGLEYVYDIETCLLCQSEQPIRIRLLPPTCRARLMSVDGGGARGIVPLEYLHALQNTIGLNYPLQDHFDFGIGTSSGGLIILAMFARCWDIQKCLRFFQTFAKQVFPSKFGSKLSILGKAKRFITSYLADGQYDATFLEKTLRQAFGSGPLFGSTSPNVSGMKIAVTATTISDATLCLFCNYNGEDIDISTTKLKHIRPSKQAEEVQVWEAARCTTAAPWFFKPKLLKDFGTFQDGGLKCNNPVKPGLREVKRIWKDEECDLVLSLGTGFRKTPSTARAPNVRNLLQDGAVARLYRASTSSLSLDGDTNWKDHWYTLNQETKDRQFRLDISLDEEPNLDDVDQMSGLQSIVRRNTGNLRDIARALKAVSFFFELAKPIYRKGTSYICEGFILLRSPDSSALISGILQEYPHARFITNSELLLGFLEDNDICRGCGRYQKPISLTLRHPSDTISIYLIFNQLFQRSISGFPHTAD